MGICRVEARFRFGEICLHRRVLRAVAEAVVRCSRFRRRAFGVRPTCGDSSGPRPRARSGAHRRSKIWTDPAARGPETVESRLCAPDREYGGVQLGRLTVRDRLWGTFAR